MPSPFEIADEVPADLQDAIASPFETATDSEINGRRAAAEKPEAMRLARAL